MLLWRLTAIILNTDAPAARRRDGVRWRQRRDAAHAPVPVVRGQPQPAPLTDRRRRVCR